MTTLRGQLARITGLVVEMLGIWGVFQSSNQPAPRAIALPGGTAVPLAWLAVGFGFILWLTGTFMIVTSRRGNKLRRIDDLDMNKEPE